MFSQGFSVIIERGISVTGHGRLLVYWLNAIGKSFLIQLMSTVQLMGEKIYDTHMVMCNILDVRACKLIWSTYDVLMITYIRISSVYFITSLLDHAYLVDKY